MGWHSRDENWRADYEHDQRKHWTPDQVPLYAEPAPPSPALETAILVRGCKDPRAGAALIEQFAATQASGDTLDATLKRITDTARQNHAVASLVGYCEGLAGSGTLALDVEIRVRRLVAETLIAFNMTAANREERVG